VSTHGCVTCVKEAAARNYAKNIERNRARIKAWDEANPGRRKQISDSWYEANKDRKALQSKMWRENNPERHAENARKWRSANIERSIAVAKAWREANPDKHKAASAAWSKANKDRKSENTARWRERNSDKYKAIHRQSQAKRRRSVRKQVVNLSDIELLEISILYEEAALLGPDWHVDHITPLSKGGEHRPYNMQIVNAKYNCTKQAQLWYIPADVGKHLPEHYEVAA
jgi:hypothetical protein